MRCCHHRTVLQETYSGGRHHHCLVVQETEHTPLSPPYGLAREARSYKLDEHLLCEYCGLWTLSCVFAQTMNETLKWLTQLPTLLQNHSGGDNVASRC